MTSTAGQKTEPYRSKTGGVDYQALASTRLARLLNRLAGQHLKDGNYGAALRLLDMVVAGVDEHGQPAAVEMRTRVQAALGIVRSAQGLVKALEGDDDLRRALPGGVTININVPEVRRAQAPKTIDLPPVEMLPAPPPAVKPDTNGHANGVSKE